MCEYDASNLISIYSYGLKYEWNETEGKVNRENWCRYSGVISETTAHDELKKVTTNELKKTSQNIKNEIKIKKLRDPPFKCIGKNSFNCILAYAIHHTSYEAISCLLWLKIGRFVLFNSFISEQPMLMVSRAINKWFIIVSDVYVFRVYVCVRLDVSVFGRWWWISNSHLWTTIDMKKAKQNKTKMRNNKKNERGEHRSCLYCGRFNTMNFPTFNWMLLLALHFVRIVVV